MRHPCRAGSLARRFARRPLWQSFPSCLLLVCGTISLGGCKELTGSQPLPAGVLDPSSFSTPAGAIAMRNQAIADLQAALPPYIIHTGLLTDELISSETGDVNGTANDGTQLDARILPTLTSGGSSGPADGDYEHLQAVRGDINQALGALATYDTGAIRQGNPALLRGELFALQGYTEILLADFFCSGVPLSTLDFQGDFTYHASSTTDQVYQDAMAKEDSALRLADTSTQLRYLASVLKGRVLLARDSVTAAAQAVATVPDDFSYQLAIRWDQEIPNLLNLKGTIADHEGGTGLPYLSSQDPRLGATTVVAPGAEGAGQPVIPLTFPARYHVSGFSPFPVASGIEARLIQAEAALRGGNPIAMVDTLNHLRETAMIPGQTRPISDATDPGDSAGRVQLLFQERAYWLFLSGHREGDLRRLIRQYGLPQGQVYPSGQFFAPGAATYGTDTNAPIPAGEYTNHLFHGCINRDA